MTHPTTPQGLLDLVPPEIREATKALSEDFVWATFIAIVEYKALTLDELFHIIGSRNYCSRAIATLAKGGLIMQYGSNLSTPETRKATTVYRPTAIGNALIHAMMDAILPPEPHPDRPTGGNSYDN